MKFKNDVLNSIKDKIVNRYKKQYENYLIQLDSEFINIQYENFQKEYDFNSQISPEILFGIYLKNKILLEYTKRINNGEIDLEIELVEDPEFKKLSEITVKKVDKTKVLNPEDILIKAVESYDGNTTFSIHIVRIAKQEYNKILFGSNESEKKVKQPDISKEKIQKSENNSKILESAESIKEDYEEKEFESESIEDKSLVLDVIEPNEEENTTSKMDIDTLAKKYLEKNQLTTIKNGYIDELVVRFNIIDKLEDIDIKNYMTLKYGYYNGIIFPNNSIKEIMNLEYEKLVELNLAVLTKLKQEISQEIDAVIESDLCCGKKAYVIKES